MNILLTTQCSLDCSYCFARSLRSTGSEMTLQELDNLLSVLEPGVDPVRLMGGEPTLHTHYAEIIRLLKLRNYEVVIFTNGLHNILRETSPHLPDRVLVNLNDWKSYSLAQRAAIRENLSFLGPRAGLGYTILDPNFDLSVHRDLILENQLHPVIRVGLAQPIVGGDNAYLPDFALPEAHRQVAAWAEDLANDRIRLSFDCGFVRSYFREADIDKLVRAHAMLRFDCTPSMDIGPGLRAVRCFAFSTFENPCWNDFTNPEHLQHWFRQQDGFLREIIQNGNPGSSWQRQDGCLARRWNRAMKTRRLDEIKIKNNVSMESI